jgi:esterase/lipase
MYKFKNGTEKQQAWADKLKTEMLNDMEEYLDSWRERTSSPHHNQERVQMMISALELTIRTVKCCQDALFFIDGKDETFMHYMAIAYEKLHSVKAPSYPGYSSHEMRKFGGYADWMLEKISKETTK